MNRALWIAQWLLALLFLFAGAAKLLAPIQPMADQVGLPGGLLLFVAVMEILGGLGLILPGLFHIGTKLTLVSALGLIVVMLGATTVTLRTGTLTMALVPFTTGLTAAFVAWGRSRLPLT
jgi:putative oxidoreductase